MKIIGKIVEWIRLEKEWWIEEVFTFLQKPPEPEKDEYAIDWDDDDD